MVEECGEGLPGNGYDRLAEALDTERTVNSVLLPLVFFAGAPWHATDSEVEEARAWTRYSGRSRHGRAHRPGALANWRWRQHVVDDKWIRPYAAVRPSEVLHNAAATLRNRQTNATSVVEDAVAGASSHGRNTSKGS
jgi:hypothetical protein